VTEAPVSASKNTTIPPRPHNQIPPEYLDAITTGDCRELVARLPDQSCALAFADPPYWVGYDYGNRTDKDMAHIDPAWLVAELRRIAPIVCVTPGIANVYRYPPADWLLAWSKPASTGRNWSGGYNVWEPVLVYGKPTRRLWQDLITAPGGREQAGAFNRCPKPLRLLTALIQAMTSPGDTVFDPVAGSGTTAVACKQLRRHYVAFEIDPDTAEKARQRVENTQQPLFVVPLEQLSLEAEGIPG